MSHSSKNGRDVRSASAAHSSEEQADSDHPTPTTTNATNATNTTAATNTTTATADHSSAPSSPTFVPREYQVPIRDASINASNSASANASSSQSRKSGTAAAGTTSTAPNVARTSQQQQQQQQQQQPHSAWEHLSTEATSHSKDPSARTRSTTTPPLSTSVPSNTPGGPTPTIHKHLSLQDRVAASALSATLELLKFAGGATLSTTGKLVAPPLYVTRNIILPNLWHAVTDYLAASTPQRAKSWLKILSSSVHHFISVLRGTKRGQVFRQRVVVVGGDILDSLSSDNARQVLMDSMGCVVKTAEALHTPEVKALLDQLSVLGCRLVDTAASGRNKQLIHDVSTMVYSGCELLADPSTTLALAEVTAYLCHALEMEDAAMHQDQTSQDVDQQASRRHERDAYQRATYVDPVLLRDPHVTVEQVILSSLGVPRGGVSSSTEFGGGGDGSAHDDDGDSVPSNVVLDDAASEIWETSSVRQQIDETRSSQSQGDNLDVPLPEQPEEQDMYQKARNSVNIGLLREKISQRATNIERTGPLPPYYESGKPVAVGSTSASTPAVRDKEPQYLNNNTSRAAPDQDNNYEEQGDFEDIGVVTTVHEDGTLPKLKRTAARQHVRLEASNDSDDADIPKEVPVPGKSKQDDFDMEWPNLVDPFPKENETSVHHFHRILDQVLEQKRGQAVETFLNDHADGKGIAKDGRAAKRQTRAAAAVTGPTGTNSNDRVSVKDTIKQRLAKIRAEVSSGLSKEELGQVNRVETIVREYHVLVTIALVAIVVIAFMWIAFGCYGIYVFFNPSVQSSWNMAKSALGGHTTSSPSSAAQEIVVRIVRTVVHVNTDGSIISQGPDSSVTQEGYDKISQCVAAAL